MVPFHLATTQHHDVLYFWINCIISTVILRSEPAL